MGYDLERTATATNTRYFLGHRIVRHSSRGCRWFTIDDGTKRFETPQLAVQFLRTESAISVAA